MGAINYLSAEQTNANTAGLTSSEHTPPTAAPTSPTEALFAVLHTDMGGLGNLFGHGATQAVSTVLDHSAATLGNLGGAMRPEHLAASNTPQPVDGHPHLGTELASNLPTVADTVRGEAQRLATFATSSWQTLRRNLGV